jgi:hypothetical protein
MRSRLTRILVIVSIGLFTACASATPASAQNAFQGAFTLPTDVRWQGNDLPAGPYTFSLKSAAIPAHIVAKGPNGATFILTCATDERASGEQSFLILERHGVTRFVREIYLAGLNLHLRYSVPRIPKDERQIAQGPATTEQVLIATTKYIHK